MALLLLTGRCYESEICANLLPLRCSFQWNPFPPKSTVSGQEPWTIVRRFDPALFVVLLLLTGRCNKAEICAIDSAPLEIRFVWPPFFAKLVSGQKPWTAVRDFDQISSRTHISSLEGAT